MERRDVPIGASEDVGRAVEAAMEGSDASALSADLAAFIDERVSSGHEPVVAETDLVMSGLVDSLGVMMIVEWLEHRLSIEVDPADVVVEHFASVDAIVGYLRTRDDCTIV